jgi:GTP-binding protein LepA
MGMDPREELSTGNVGYVICNIKTAKEVRVGDTITHVKNGCTQRN